MAEPVRNSDTPQNSDEARQGAVQDHGRQRPSETENHGMERGPASLGEDIRARTMRPHKGDVGRPGTNEEVFQGSKEKELE